MMPMHFPYGNPNTSGQHIYGPAVCPNFGVNYFTPFYSNSNGLLPPPRAIMLPPPPQPSSSALIERNKKSSFISDIDSNSFLQFIEKKTKPISELNPFANEFSLIKSNNENNSSYKLIFDNLIEQSLQSIDAIKKASKIHSVNHVSTQYNASIDQINRSTQTTNENLLEEYSTNTVKLMNKLLENFKYILLLTNDNNFHNELLFMSEIFDELHYLILVINQIIISNKSSLNRNYLFSNMIKNLTIQSSQSSISDNEKDIYRSIYSQQIDSIINVTSKICLLCQKPVDDSNDIMHKLCRLLSSPPDT